MKQRVTLNLDGDVYLMAKNAEVNLSETVTTLLREYFKTQQPHEEEAKVLDRIESRRRIIEREQEALGKDTVLLVHLRESRTKQDKQTEEQREALRQAFVHNNPLRFS